MIKRMGITLLINANLIVSVELIGTSLSGEVLKDGVIVDVGGSVGIGVASDPAPDAGGVAVAIFTGST